MSPESGARPDFAELLDLVDGRLDPASAARTRELARGDSEATASLRWIAGFVESTRAMPLHQPPPIVRQGLQNYFARWSRARATLDRPRLEFPASLLFDSRLDLATVGVRGADDTEGIVHLAYTTDRADLVLDVRPLGAGLVQLDGQVLLTQPSTAPIFEATALGPQGALRTVDGDALGNFSLTGVPVDVTELRVSNGDLLIVAAVNLQDQAGDR